MSTEVRRTFVTRVSQLVENVSDVTASGQRRTRMMIDGDISFTLIDEHADSFDVLLRSVLDNDDWGAKFSEQYIQKELRRVLAALLRNGTPANVAAYLDELFAKLNAFQKVQVVLIPLVGIELQEDSFPFGSVVLRNMTDVTVDALLRDIAGITETAIHSDEEKAWFTSFYQQEVAANVRKQVCAEYHVVAEPIRARERGIEEVHRVSELLRYASSFLYHADWRVAVGVVGEIATVPRWAVAISDDAYSSASNWVVAMRNFEFTPKNIQIMRDMGVFAMAEVLCKPVGAVTDFEQALLRAVRWFAHAQTQTETSNQLLSLITSLETLLTPRDNNPIGTAIAEGTAILIADGVAQRRDLKKRVQELYRLRSAVSHGGKKAILQSDVEDLRGITGALMAKLITRKGEFLSQKTLLEWLEATKFGG